MILNNSEESSLKKIIIALVFLILPVACDGGADNGGGGQQPAQVASACDGFVPTMTGTNGNDVLTGTPGDDIIVGLAGNDTIDGQGGNDRICGDSGNDNLMGGNGNDILDGGPGDDIMDGQSGADIIIEDPGSDDIFFAPPLEFVLANPGVVLDEISFTNADESITLDLTTNDMQTLTDAGDTGQLNGFFPNIYGSFNPDNFFFSNASHNGVQGHVFDPAQGAGTDVLIIDAAGFPAKVVKETSFFEGAGGTLQGDTTITVGDTVLNTVNIEDIIVLNPAP